MAFVLRCTFLLQFVSLYLPCGFKADWGVVGCNFCCNLFLLACLVGLHQEGVVGCKYLSQSLLASLMGLIQFGCCGLQFLAAICFSLLTLNQLSCCRLQSFVVISPCLPYGLDPIRVLCVSILFAICVSTLNMWA